MNDLVTWLRAQLDEDERLASAVLDHEIFDGTGIVIQRGPAPRRSVEKSIVMPSHVTRHITRHGPARVLADVEATRYIIGEHSADDAGNCQVCCWHVGSGEGRAPRPFPCSTLKMAAWAKRDRPGYKDAWLPHG